MWVIGGLVVTRDPSQEITPWSPGAVKNQSRRTLGCCHVILLRFIGDDWFHTFHYIFYVI